MITNNLKTFERKYHKNIIKKTDLPDIVIEALKHYNKKSHHIDIAKYIHNNYEHILKMSGDIYYEWQYLIRWAATHLRKSGIMKNAQYSDKGFWELI